MLSHLTIKNYALIEELEIGFDAGFNTITGETGAGKSILLGALSLVLGKRADLSSLRNKERKCVVEAEFLISDYNLRPFFEENELDYEAETLVRREILPSGKSRAFVNDSPVNLTVLSSLGEQLVDIHSQHQTLQLTENEFQFKVIDAFAGNVNMISRYCNKLKAYRINKNELEALIDRQEQATATLDYNSFLLEELNKAQLKPGLQEELEEEYEQLNNVEVILENLTKSQQLINDEEIGVVTQLLSLKRALGKITSFSKNYAALHERIGSLAIEIDDILSELDLALDQVEPNPSQLEIVNSKLGLIHDLFKKHQVSTEQELLDIKEDLETKVDDSLNISSKIEAQKALVEKEALELDKMALDIRKNRIKASPVLQKVLQEALAHLGMPSANFKIEVTPSDDFNYNGKDNLSFLFSANKGSDYGQLKKVASGGELSRIMLVIKSILAKYDKLPTLIFDEIDTGVSGDISNKMGGIMKKMGENMQIMSITHLPQVAAQGEYQFKVYKQVVNDNTNTYIKKLNKEERIDELAEMLGGKQWSESAIQHAKELLINKTGL